MNFHSFINLNLNEIRTGVIEVLAADPTGVLGRFYVNSGSKRLRIHDGTTWQEYGTGTGTVTNVTVNSLPPLFTTGVVMSSTTPEVSFTLSTASQNAVWAGPASGGAGTPGYRGLVQADIPASIPLSYWGAATANINLGAFLMSSSSDPVSPNDFTRKQWVENLFQGVRDYKESVRVAAAGNVAGTYTATGGASTRGQFSAMPNTLNGVTLVAGDRLLLPSQTNAAQNGIWVVTTLGTGANGVWDRASDFDTDAEVSSGTMVYVSTFGTTDNRGSYVLTTADPIVVGGASGTNLSFTQISAVGGYVAGGGMTLTGYTFDIVSANTGIVVNADNIALNLNSTASGLEIFSGLRIKPDVATANTLPITITANGAGIPYNSTSFVSTAGVLTLAATVAPAAGGLTLSAGALSVNVDNATLYVNTNQVKVKPAGIDHTHISSAAFGTSITGGSGTQINVAGYTFVTGTTVARKYTTTASLATGAFTNTITHGLNTKDVQVYVRNSTTDAFILTEMVHTSVNVVTISGNNNTGAAIGVSVIVIG